jgi:hypothetical protein
LSSSFFFVNSLCAVIFLKKLSFDGKYMIQVDGTLAKERNHILRHKVAAIGVCSDRINIKRTLIIDDEGDPARHPPPCARIEFAIRSAIQFSCTVLYVLVLSSAKAEQTHVYFSHLTLIRVFQSCSSIFCTARPGGHHPMASPMNCPVES